MVNLKTLYTYEELDLTRISLHGLVFYDVD